jgi:hypothetical protein
MFIDCGSDRIEPIEKPTRRWKERTPSADFISRRRVKPAKELRTSNIMIIESRTLFIVCQGHDITCVQMNRLQPEICLLIITRPSNVNIQGGTICWTGRWVSLGLHRHSDLLTVRIRPTNSTNVPIQLTSQKASIRL